MLFRSISKPLEFRERKQVIYASPLVDVAANMELVRETVDICTTILAQTNWDIRLLSKSNLLPKVAGQLEERFEQSGHARKRVIYGVSTGTMDDRLAAAFEEGAPLVSKRIESLHWLQDNGFRTFGMICPSLPLPSVRDYEDFAAEMSFHIRAEKCEHVWAEVINVRGDSLKRTVAKLHEHNYHGKAEDVERVSGSKQDWEQYARNTFEAHCQFIPPEKLRFLQYATKETLPYWEAMKKEGAVLL